MKIINESVPTVMFHSLSYYLEDPFYLSFPYNLFVDYIKNLIASDYHFVTIEQIVNTDIDRNQKNICFTFDDGFEDNYTVLFPILKYFNIPCTVFISGDFIAAGQLSSDSITSSTWMRNFLSKKQLIEMQKSGLVDFQGHSKSHTWYPISGTVLEHHDISDIERYYWIYWNAFPKDKPYQIKQENVSAYSKFVSFQYERSLASRRYIPDSDEFCCGNKEDVSGRFETDDQMFARFEDEIIKDKHFLENILDKELCFLCWPGGEMCKESYITFKKSGYKACSVPSNHNKVKVANKIFLSEQNVIKRISPAHFWKKYDMGSEIFIHNVKQFTRKGINKWLCRKITPRLLLLRKYCLKSL